MSLIQKEFYESQELLAAYDILLGPIDSVPQVTAKDTPLEDFALLSRIEVLAARILARKAKEDDKAA